MRLMFGGKRGILRWWGMGSLRWMTWWRRWRRSRGGAWIRILSRRRDFITGRIILVLRRWECRRLILIREWILLGSRRGGGLSGGNVIRLRIITSLVM